MEPKTILKTAERRGLNAIAVTDHNTIAGGMKTLRLNEKHSIIVIVGAEIATNIGDIIGLFLNEEIKSKDALDVIYEIKSQSGLVLIPHPFKMHKFDDIKPLMNNIDLLEGYNSRHPVTLEQMRSLKLMNKPLVAGSDAHFSREIGLSQTILQCEVDDEEEIRKILLSGKINIRGIFAPSYFEPMSQIIKGLNCKDLKILGWASINLMRSLFSRQYSNFNKSLLVIN